MNEITLKILSFALLRSWGRDTAKGKWKKDVPAINQCAVTALVVQDFFGGEILSRQLDDGESHYWNRIGNGTEIDLTFSQFAVMGQREIGETVARKRDYFLIYPNTVRRYKILRDRVEDELGIGEGK